MSLVNESIGRPSARAAIPALRWRTPILITLTMILLGVILLSAGIGAVNIRPAQVIGIVLDDLGISTDIEFESRQRTLLMVVRLPRVIMGVLVGAMLAASGAALQGLFRSPLADPSLLGISNGSALTVTIGIALGVPSLFDSGFASTLILPLMAFIGGILTTALIYRLATHSGRTNVATMLLAGVAINALAGAGVGLLTFMTGDITGGMAGGAVDAAFWTLGSLSRTKWQLVEVVLPIALLTLGILPFMARPLNILLLGEAEAGHLGVDVQRTRQIIMLITAFAVGTCVAAAGVIGFVALLVPYLLRRLVGSDFRILLPGSMLLGAILLVLTDLVARTIAMPIEVPIGVLTTLIGGPVFLWLLLRDRRILS